MMAYKVCVAGLGYVGLPLAVLAVSKGNTVSGFDIDQEKINKLQRGECPFTDKDLSSLLKSWSGKITFSVRDDSLNGAEVIIICVPTPVDKNNKPDLAALKAVSATVAKNLEKGQLIVVESTIFPGTMEEIVLPILEEGGFVVGRDFYLAHCPERIDPGNKTYTLPIIPRIVGGITEACTEKALEFYSLLLTAPITKLSSIKAVETTKIVENTFRDVNIALVNELARSFDVMGIDITEVLRGASTKPFAFLPHYPGCGVGGHCIPVDPYYLIERSRQSGFEHKFLSLARIINKEMPHYTVQRAIEGLKTAGVRLKDAKIAVLGLAYKQGVSDTRESPVFDIIKELEKLELAFTVYDPYVLEKSDAAQLPGALVGKNCIILATAHPEFKELTPELLKKQQIKVVIDGRNFLDKAGIEKEGIIYRGIGR